MVVNFTFVDTLVGVVRIVVVPSPSCPLSFMPQHHAVPSASSPQEYLSPADIFTNVRAVTSEGPVESLPVQLITAEAAHTI
jgi:hypothetical protein